MQKIFLSLFISLFLCTLLKAQQVDHLNVSIGYLPEISNKSSNSLLSDPQYDTTMAWYNFVDEESKLTTFQSFDNTFLFPDSFVKQTTGPGKLGYVQLHSIGQILDPGSSFFNTRTSALYTGYRLDTVAFYYAYNYHVPGSTDTLIVQFYKDSAAKTGGIKRNTLSSSGEKTAYIAYDAKTKSGAGAVKEVKILLTEADTSNEFRKMTIAIPNGGIDIPRAGSNTSITSQALSGFTVTYKPGYKYAFGDTLDSRWNTPAPAKLLNNFRVLIKRNMDKSINDNSYNNGVRLTTPVRYGLPSAGGWANYYIAGDAWQEYTEHFYASFHLTIIEPSSVKEEVKTQNGYVFGNIFPNPTEGNATLEFTLPKTENINVKIYNTVGQLVNTVANGTYASGKHTLNINGENMKPGVYFYTIQAGNFVQIKSFSVVK